jgi:uncharacterized damage-inducible protein DinB
MDAGFQLVDGMFKTSTDLVNKATAGIPPELWLRRPGDDSNHLMWVMGHLVWARGLILKTLGSDISIHWAPQFARGAKCEDGQQYPKVEEICSAWTDVSERLAKCLAQVPAEVLEKPHDKPTFDGKVGGFVAFLAFHESYHVGQVSYLRKWLGHGQVVG